MVIYFGVSGIIMKRLHTGLLAILFSLSIFQSAIAEGTDYIEGKDYDVIINNPGVPTLPEKTITVTEFFSYGCPWCYELEPQLQKWLKTKPTSVKFERVPVIFEKNWDYYAKAYYIAKALDIESQITPKLFNAIQEQNKTLGSDSAMQKFFIKEGVQKNVVQNAFQASPTLDAEIKQGPQLMHSYQVYVIPAIVVDGKYKTDLRMAMTDEKFMNIVQFLVEKRKKEKGIH